MILLLIGLANLVVGVIEGSWPNVLIGISSSCLGVMYLKGWEKR